MLFITQVISVHKDLSITAIAARRADSTGRRNTLR